jgi:hypothetical protein
LFSNSFVLYRCIIYKANVQKPQECGNSDEKYLEVGKRTSEDIDSFLMEGATKLKVQRFSSGTDMCYHIISA